MLLARTSGMNLLEAQYCGCVLLATAVGDRAGKLMPAALLDILERKLLVRPSHVCIEVATCPHDLWITFTDGALCTCVMELSM